MEKQLIYLDKWNWSVRVFYESMPGDAEEILDDLELIECDERSMSTAISNLMKWKPNTGLTYSNVNIQASVVVISKTTSASEFVSTFDHEKMHLAFHIAGALCIDVLSEEFAYLVGEIGRQMYRVAKKYMCECCRCRTKLLS